MAVTKHPFSKTGDSDLQITEKRPRKRRRESEKRYALGPKERVYVIGPTDRLFGASFAWNLVEQCPVGVPVVLTLPCDERVTATALVYLCGITRSLLVGAANREGVALEDLISGAKEAALNAAKA